jgi:outer membrane protein W
MGGLITLLGCAIAAPSPAYDLIGNGAVGIRGGSVVFTQDKEIKDAASPRLSGDMVFSYVYSDHITADVIVGYGWNRLDSGSDQFWLVTTTPITLGARYALRDGKVYRPFLGAGGGMYVWSVQTKDLGAAKDPATFERLRRADLGFYGTAGVERRMSKHIMMTGDASYHYILAKDVADFPSGYNGNKGYYQVRIGLSLFFSLSERIDSGLPE